MVRHMEAGRAVSMEQTGDDGVERVTVEVEARNIVVPLDGSRRAVRAILPARRLAAALGLPVGVISVAETRGGLTRPELDAIVAEHRLHWALDVRASSAVDGIVDTVRGHDAIVVMTSGGHGRSAAVVGSTAAGVVERSPRPVMLVGHGTEVAERRPISELVVAVSGAAADMSLCGVAVSLARTYDFELRFVTVVASTSESGDARRTRTDGSAPLGDARGYLDGLVDHWGGGGVRLVGSTIHDPISAASGLAQMLQRRPQAVLVVGSAGRVGLTLLRHDSTSSAIVSESPVPTIVVPVPPEGTADG